MSTFAVTAAPYDATLLGGPASATMNFAGTYSVVDPNGPATGVAYLDTVVTPAALLQGAVSYVVLTGEGSSGASAGFNDLPIQVTMVGFAVPEPSTSMLLVGACSLIFVKRRR